jgi:hypothetical protein
MVAKRLADFEDCSEFVASQTGDPRTLVGRACNLVEVPTDRSQLCDGALEALKFLPRQGYDCSQVGTDKYRNIGRRRRAARSRSLVQEEVIFSR